MNQETKNRIDKEANDYLIKLQVSSASIDPRRDGHRRKGYIAGATAEAARSETVVEALENLIHLHMCEQEGLLSGKPTPEQWLETVGKASEALSQYNHPF